MKLKADGVAAKERHDSRVHLIAPLPSLMYCSQHQFLCRTSHRRGSNRFPSLPLLWKERARCSEQLNPGDC
jgi:hypothetical protein